MIDLEKCAWNLAMTDTLLAAVNDNFILYLLGIIEGASDDADDPYHYPVIRVLVRFEISFCYKPH